MVLLPLLIFKIIAWFPYSLKITMVIINYNCDKSSFFNALFFPYMLLISEEYMISPLRCTHHSSLQSKHQIVHHYISPVFISPLPILTSPLLHLWSAFKACLFDKLSLYFLFPPFCALLHDTWPRYCISPSPASTMSRFVKYRAIKEY